MNGIIKTSEYMDKVLSAFNLTPTGIALKDYFQYYRAWAMAKSSDGFRKTHDLDYVVMDGNFYADTIFSFWMILKMYLQVNFPGEFKAGSRGMPNKNVKTCELLFKEYEKYFDPNGVGKDLNEFASLAQSPANFMILSDRSMQSRGMYYFDQMPVTLFQCFEDGRYAKCFKEISVETWVKEQRLEVFFSGEIDREHIKSLGPIPKEKAYWCRTKDEVDFMLKEYISILKSREF